MMGLGMGLGLLLLLLFWGGLIVGAVWLARALFNAERRGSGPTGAPRARPREILDERYARGEISREEYERIRAELGV